MYDPIFVLIDALKRLFVFIQNFRMEPLEIIDGDGWSSSFVLIWSFIICPDLVKIQSSHMDMHIGHNVVRTNGLEVSRVQALWHFVQVWLEAKLSKVILHPKVMPILIEFSNNSLLHFTSIISTFLCFNIPHSLHYYALRPSWISPVSENGQSLPYAPYRR